MPSPSNCILVRTLSEGKINQLIKQKRAFLRQATKDYAAGGSDMLDDIDSLLQEAKAELTHNLELASCLKEESEATYQKECFSMYSAWYEKWFGKA
jgi:hypothetical protein